LLISIKEKTLMNRSRSRRNSLRSILILSAALLLAGICLAQGSFVTFDGPHAGVASGHGTFPSAMNRLGGIALITIDDNNTTRAYVRHHKDGTYHQIQPPNTVATYISGLNSQGQVAGLFYNSSQQGLGYVRNVDGTYVILSPPGNTGVINIVGINQSGQVAGNAYFGSGGAMPFFWDPANPNTYVTFSVAGATFPAAKAINDSGQIAGAYTDTKSNRGRGFLRNSDGSISTFTLAPYLGVNSLSVAAMNNWGTVLGGFFDSNGSDAALFLRYSGGGQKYAFGLSHGGLEPAAINDNGIVVGTDFGGDTQYGNAFSVDKSLTVTLIPVPFSSQGTTANAVNNAGQIVGTYIDDNGASHGWIYLP
jgi:hypothetical protein